MTGPEVTLVDLDQDLPGQREFICCWVSQQPDLTFLVDPGPPATTGVLLARLQDLGVAHLDFILLTHVHLDHAGGAAAILDAYPAARVVCHERGAPHLVDPARLWQASREVLREAAEVYGAPRGVPAGAVAPIAQVAAHGIKVVLTPGHAAHHVCYLHAHTLFVGEAAGTCAALPDGQIYFRPATPPRFDLKCALESLDRLLAISPAPRRLAFAHHGMIRERTREILAAARRQLLIWVQVCREERASQASNGFSAVMERISTRLLACDPCYGRLRELPADIQTRELVFARQSLRGILGYLSSAG